VDARLGVLGRRVHREETQRRGARVDDCCQRVGFRITGARQSIAKAMSRGVIEMQRMKLTVVLGALRDDDEIARLDLLLLSADDGLADTRREDQVLVYRVYLASAHFQPINSAQARRSLAGFIPHSPPRRCRRRQAPS
jgi:hypothetical protein